ncbi:MAG: hypothetical protein AAF485_33300, partial [Chloroflexota bacterium]
KMCMHKTKHPQEIVEWKIRTLFVSEDQLMMAARKCTTKNGKSVMNHYDDYFGLNDFKELEATQLANFILYSGWCA